MTDLTSGAMGSSETSVHTSQKSNIHLYIF